MKINTRDSSCAMITTFITARGSGDVDLGSLSWVESLGIVSPRLHQRQLQNWPFSGDLASPGPLASWQERRAPVKQSIYCSSDIALPVQGEILLLKRWHSYSVSAR